MNNNKDKIDNYNDIQIDNQDLKYPNKDNLNNNSTNQEKKKFKLTKSNKIQLTSITILVLLLLFLTSLLFSNSSNKVLDFSNKKLEDIIKWQETNNIDSTLIKLEYEFNDQYPNNHVISQSIKAGNKLDDKGITFIISNGFDLEETIKIKDLNNLNYKQINDYFTKTGFINITYKEEYHNKIPKDTFIKIEPIKEKYKRNETITITLSKGNDDSIEIEFEDFTNKSQNEIEEYLKSKGFTNIIFEYESSKTIKEGKFISINPKQKAQKDQQITITISNGQENQNTLIDIPNFINQSKSNVDKWSKTNKITIKYTYIYSNTIEYNHVIKHIPVAQKQISKSSKLEVTLSKGKEITVPNFINKNIDELIKWSNSNSINISTYKYQYSNKPKDTIISTNPSSNTKISQNTSIQPTVSIGKILIKNHIDNNTQTFIAWLNSTNNLNEHSAKLTYNIIEEESNKTINTIIKMKIGSTLYTTKTSPTILVNPSTNITIYISKPKQINVQNKKGETKNNFENYIKNLKLIPKGQANYHDTISNNLIISNDQGIKNQNDIINYIYSIGPYKPNINQFNNKTIDEINNILKEANNKAANYKYKTISQDYNSTIPLNKTFNCTNNTTNKTIQCHLSKGINTSINVISYTNKTISEFISEISSLQLIPGNKIEEYHDTIAKGLVISNDQGNKTIGDIINYKVSKGPYPTININKAIKSQIATIALSTNNQPDTVINAIKVYITNNLIPKGTTYDDWNIQFNKVNSDVTKGHYLPNKTIEKNYKMSDLIEFDISLGP